MTYQIQNIEYHQYDKVSYWNQRYANQEEKYFDWYVTYDQMQPILEDVFSRFDNPSTTQILILGCGNSRLAGYLFREGFKNITCVDRSHVVIQKMRENHRNQPEIIFMVMDVLEMSFEKRFDVVLDKACLDCICGGTRLIRDVNQYLSRVHDIMNTGGIYMCVSAMPPENRLEIFRTKRFSWTIEAVKKILKVPMEVALKFPGLAKGQFYVYTITKDEEIVEEEDVFGSTFISLQRVKQTKPARPPVPSQKKEADEFEKQLSDTAVSRLESML